MTEYPAITIITPVLNAAKDIETCILSVAGQTFPGKEHLIVDGDSTDGTVAIIRRYAEQYPHITLISEKDDGIYDAMNKGIGLAKGDWLYFLGCDDVFSNEKVLEEIFSLDAIDSFDVVYGNVLWGDTGRVYDGKFSRLKLMEQNICHQAIMMKRSLFDRLGTFDVSYKIWADYLLNLKWFNRDDVRVKYVDLVIAKYGIDGRSSRMEDADFVQERERLFQEYFPPEYMHNRKKLQNFAAEIDKKGHQVAYYQKEVADRDRQIAEGVGQIAERDRQIAERDRQIAERIQKLAELQYNLDQHQLMLNLLYSSLSWRVTAPLRLLHSRLLKAKSRCRMVVQNSAVFVKSKTFVIGSILGQVGAYLRTNRKLPGRRGMQRIIRRALEVSAAKCGAVLDPYASWCEVNGWNDRREQVIVRQLARLERRPLISIVMPVYNPPLEFFTAAIDSVFRQVYADWELCIADDASSDPRVTARLRELAAQDSRVKIAFRTENGNISLATNSAAALASGEYLLLMDQDDELTPDALAHVALRAVAEPAADVIYSDDDKIDADGERFAPQFKPDWSPELLLNYMYFSHLFVIRRELYHAVGGMRAGFEGSQDYDLALRVTEQARIVAHIPQVLYHWRVLPGSTAASGDAKPASFSAGLRAVQEALDRRGVRAEVSRPAWAVAAKCGIFAPTFPDDGPSVAIIIPTKNKVEVLRTCIRSIKERTSYRNYKIVIIDNESDDPETLRYFADSPERVLRIDNPGGRFNYAAINNRAVEQVDSEYVLFLNNDTEVVSSCWLSQMVGYLGMAGVGAVGAKLVFPDDRLQHAGIIHGLYGGMAGPAFKLLPSWDSGYLSYVNVARNYSAVTAACMLTPRRLFLETGGFDADTFAVAYNDVDYCYRLRQRSSRVVYCPAAELLHYENYSRGGGDNPAEIAAFKRKYHSWNDPYYNPNLSLDDERFAIAGRTLDLYEHPPIRTLMCAFNLNLEGAPYSQYELTVYLKRTGVIEPVVYCHLDGPLRRLYEEAGIPVEIFPHPLLGKTTLADYQQAIREFAAWIGTQGCELVYGNTLQTFYAIAAAREARLPSIWNPRESEPWQTYFDFLGEEIARNALECFRYPYRVIFVAEATRAAWSPLNSRQNFTTIHNGLDPERLASTLAQWPREQARAALAVAAGEIMILLLGTVCERKGQLDLLEAVMHLPAQDQQRVKVFIVGDRPSGYSQRLHDFLAAMPASVRERVRLVPETHDTALFYAAADIFVCSSRIESYPRVILEAMACTLPIVTTPVFGIAEQVRENVNGFFYAPGDSRALATALSRLVSDDSLRTTMAEKSGQVLACLNDFESMANAYGQQFREAWLSGGPRGCAA